MRLEETHLPQRDMWLTLTCLEGTAPSPASFGQDRHDELWLDSLLSQLQTSNLERA